MRYSGVLGHMKSGVSKYPTQNIDEDNSARSKHTLYALTGSVICVNRVNDRERGRDELVAWRRVCKRRGKDFSAFFDFCCPNVFVCDTRLGRIRRWVDVH